MKNTSTVTERIRSAMLQGDKTRYAIAKETGLAEAALCRFAAGGGLRIESLELLARALGLEIVVRARKG